MCLVFWSPHYSNHSAYDDCCRGESREVKMESDTCKAGGLLPKRCTPLSSLVTLLLLCQWGFCIYICIRFAWSGFGRRGVTGVSSLRRCQNLTSCLIEPMLAGSKMCPLLSKAESIGNGDTFCDNIFGKGKTLEQRPKKSWEYVRKLCRHQGQ